MKIIATLAAALLFALGVSAQNAPIAVNPLVEVHGTIQRIRISPGQGMPYLEVSDGERSVNVYLSPMRYLIEQNFNPRVGQTLTIKGYRVDKDLVAATVSIDGENRVLRFRDEHGWPMWRGEMRRGGRPNQ
jgi:hypothetical protein